MCITWGFLWGFSFDNVLNVRIELIFKYMIKNPVFHIPTLSPLLALLGVTNYSLRTSLMIRMLFSLPLFMSDLSVLLAGRTMMLALFL